MNLKKFLSSALALSVFVVCFSCIGARAVWERDEASRAPNKPGYIWQFTRYFNDFNSANNYINEMNEQGYGIERTGNADQYYVHVYAELQDVNDYDAYMNELAEQF